MAAGADAKAVQQMLGPRAMMTLDLYGQLYDDHLDQGDR
jgi:site-specific recombinase XerD